MIMKRRIDIDKLITYAGYVCGAVLGFLIFLALT